MRNRARRFRLEAIICDVDDVILTFDPQIYHDIETRHNLPAGWPRQVLTEWPTALLASVGTVSYRQWLGYARETLPPQAVQEWLEHHGRINQPVVDTLTSARRAGVRLLLMANSTGRLHEDLAHHHLEDLAEQVHTSASIGYTKPDPTAFEHVLHTACLNHARTLLIDDHPPSVHTARGLGMRGHLYVGACQLQAGLAQTGVVA